MKVLAILCLVFSVQGIACENEIRTLVETTSKIAKIETPRVKFSDTLQSKYRIRAVSSFVSRTITFDTSICNATDAEYVVRHEIGHLMDFKEFPERYSLKNYPESTIELIADYNAAKLLVK